MTTIDVVQETREERIAIAKAHARVIQAGWKVEGVGIKLSAIAASSSLPGQFERLISALSIDQAIVLRDYFKSLLEFAEATQEGEVVLSTVDKNTIKLVMKDSGLNSFLHDLLEVDISVKKLEANATAKSVKNKPNLAESLRKFKEQVEHGAGEVASQFVA